MHSYFPYWASACPDVKTSRAFVIGLEMPDFLNDTRQKFKKNGVAEAHAAYLSLQEEVDGMPDFSRFFAERMQQKEREGTTFGLHFGKKYSPDVLAFWKWLPKAEKNKPFWRGYLWHLLTDRLINPRIDTDAKVKEFIDSHIVSADMSVTLIQESARMLATDWHKVNQLLIEKYPDVRLTPEVEFLGTNITMSVPDMSLKFIDFEVLTSCIDFLRGFDPLCNNIEDVIQQILAF